MPPPFKIEVPGIHTTGIHGTCSHSGMWNRVRKSAMPSETQSPNSITARMHHIEELNSGSLVFEAEIYTFRAGR